jgi:hypothetical protein
VVGGNLKMCQKIFELGRLSLEFGLTALIQIGKKKFYAICKPDKKNIWTPGETTGKILAFYNTVTVKGRVPCTEVVVEEIIYGGEKKPLEPYSIKNGVKRYASKHVIKIRVRNLKSKETRGFKVHRERTENGKTLHIESFFQNFTEPLGQRLDLENFKNEGKKLQPKKTKKKKEAKIDKLERKEKINFKQNKQKNKNKEKASLKKLQHMNSKEVR